MVQNLKYSYVKPHNQLWIKHRTDRRSLTTLSGRVHIYLYINLCHLHFLKWVHITSDEFQEILPQNMLYCHTGYCKMQKFEKQQVLKDSMAFSSSSYYCRVRDDLLGLPEGSKVLRSTIWRGESCSSLWTLLRTHRNLISTERSAWPLCPSSTLSCYRDPSVSSVHASS